MKKVMRKKDFEEYVQFIKESTHYEIIWHENLEKRIELVIITDSGCVMWKELKTFKEAYFILSGFEIGILTGGKI